MRYYGGFEDEYGAGRIDGEKRWVSDYTGEYSRSSYGRAARSSQGEDQEPELVVYPLMVRRRPKRACFLRVVAVACAALLMMVSSAIMGAGLAQWRFEAAVAELEAGLAQQQALAAREMRNLQAAQSQMLLGDFAPTATIIPAGEFNPGGQHLTLPQLFLGVNPSVVAISTQTSGRNAFGRVISRPAAGSGFIISEDGYIVTNNHVIEDANSISVLLYNGTSFPADVVGRDHASDLAVLRIEAQGLMYLTLAESDMLLVGEQVAAIGNPLGEFANSLTAGVISALNREINIDGIPREMLQTDAAINNGNSGGPLINMQGQVVGVVTAKSGGMNVEGLGFAIPSNIVRYITADLITDGYVRGRAVMGVQIGMMDAGGGQARVIVDSVLPGSGALRAGVQPGDIILSANGTEVHSFQELRQVLDTLAPGDAMPLVVLRNGTSTGLVIVLDEFRPTYG